VTRGVVIVLGACGFIGRHVCRRLSWEDFEVIGLGHGEWAAEEWTLWGLSRWVKADITIESLAATGSRRVVALVHCAGTGAVSYAHAAPFDDYQRSVATAACVLEFARAHCGAEARVVLASSAAVYGDQGEVDLTETAMRSPISPYGFSKVAAENLCDVYSRFFEVQSSVIRLFSVYGEGLRKQLLWDAMRKFSAGERRFFGTGNELRDWIHVEDAASLMCAAVSAPQASFEVFNGGHVKATTREVLAALADRSGGSEPAFTGETHAGNPRRLTANWQHAARQLGWRPQVDLETGLARYVQWFNTMGEV
jgi:UDP-glucose 4-epimerase